MVYLVNKNVQQKKTNKFAQTKKQFLGLIFASVQAGL